MTLSPAPPPTPAGSFVASTLHDLSTVSTPSAAHTASTALLTTFQHALRSHPTPNMLPSYITDLPTGSESGTSLALDLGGSTLRVALLHLSSERPKVLARTSSIMSEPTKRLPAAQFFDRLASALSALPGSASATTLGVTWSFPLLQTGLAAGRIQKMGKGYAVHDSAHNGDLRELLEAALRRTRTLAHVRVAAVMNDTEATLLAGGTVLSLICGTGLNAAAMIPVRAIASEKFSDRRKGWLEKHRAAAVCVNTEASMFGGKEVLPTAQIDRMLDSESEHPGFQPLEQMCSGRYLGELFRLALRCAVEAGEILDGRVSGRVGEQWGVDTALAAKLGTHDTTPSMVRESLGLDTEPSTSDVMIVRQLAQAVSSRAAVYLAVTVWALWCVQRDAGLEVPQGEVRVAFCGAVLEKHRRVREECQEMLDKLVELEGEGRRVVLVHADDSGLVGAGIGAVVNAWNERVKSRI